MTDKLLGFPLREMTEPLQTPDVRFGAYFTPLRISLPLATLESAMGEALELGTKIYTLIRNRENLSDAMELEFIAVEIVDGPAGKIAIFEAVQNV